MTYILWGQRVLYDSLTISKMYKWNWKLILHQGTINYNVILAFDVLSTAKLGDNILGSVRRSVCPSVESVCQFVCNQGAYAVDQLLIRHVAGPGSSPVLRKSQSYSWSYNHWLVILAVLTVLQINPSKSPSNLNCVKNANIAVTLAWLLLLERLP